MEFFVVDEFFFLLWWSFIFIGVDFMIVYWFVFLCFVDLLGLMLFVLFWWCFLDVDFVIEYLFWNWIILIGVIVCGVFWLEFGVFWVGDGVCDFLFGVVCCGGVGVFKIFGGVDLIVIGDWFLVCDL